MDQAEARASKAEAREKKATQEAQEARDMAAEAMAEVCFHYLSPYQQSHYSSGFFSCRPCM